MAMRPPRTIEMTILAQDPSVTGPDGEVLLGTVHIPAERIQPGPRGPRVQVARAMDAGDGFPRAGAEARQRLVRSDEPLATEYRDHAWRYDDPFAGVSFSKIAADPALRRRFRAQHVYGAAVRLLASFEHALGRRVRWLGGAHRLTIVPEGAEDWANAYYDPTTTSLSFGYFETGSRTLFTSESYDVVVHEASHALIDGLRPRLKEGLGGVDEAASHEAIADIVSVLSAFSILEVVEALLGRPDRYGRIPQSRLDPGVLVASPLFSVGEEFGAAKSDDSGPLRSSGQLEPDPSLLEKPEFQLPHRRGEILVSAVVRAVIGIWRKRIQPLLSGGGRIDRRGAAEEGAKSAGHMLNMVLRAIDYFPPVQLEFSDFLEALLVADAAVAPDDDRGYRDSLRESFAGFGITPATTGLHAHQLGALRYAGFSLDDLRSQRDEVYRFMWENAETLDVDPDNYVDVDDVWTCLRLGPDGLVVAESVACYAEALPETYQQAARGHRLPMRLRDADRAPDPDPVERGGITLGPSRPQAGGGTLIFDQFGQLKYHKRKPPRASGSEPA